MSLDLSFGFGVNKAGQGALPDYALEFNGSDEYLQITLPNNELLATPGVVDFYSSGSVIAGWTATGIDWAGATAGKTYTNTIVGEANEFIQKTISGLVVGQKYKLKLRYQSTDSFVISDGTTPYFTLQASTDWNTVSKIFTATGTTIKFTSAGAWVLDWASVKFDQGFDLNKDQEQILHSRNAEFNNAGCDWVAYKSHTVALSTVDKSEGTGSLLITSTGAGNVLDDHVLLPSANLESCVVGKKYTLQGEARLDASSLGYGANVLSNGDFETGINTDNLQAESNCTLTFNNTETGKTGNYCLKAVTTQALYGFIKTLTINKFYKITLKYKSPVTISVRSGNSIVTLPIVADWTTTTIYIQSNAAEVRFWLTTASTAYFDNIVIQQADMINLTIQLGTKSVTSSALSIVAGTFTKFVLNFEATASEVNQDLKLWLSGAGSVYVDKLSLTQAYDAQTYLKILPTETAKRTVYNIDANNFLEFRADGKIGVSVSDGTNTITNIAEVAYTPNQWIELIIELNRTGNVKIIKGTGTPTGTTIITVGKIIKTATTSGFRIGANASAGETFKGQISKVVRTLYDNLTGLVEASENLRVTFQSGYNITECLKDYSPKGHTVSGVNMDITNRKRVTI